MQRALLAQVRRQGRPRRRPDGGRDRAGGGGGVGGGCGRREQGRDHRDQDSAQRTTARLRAW
ncbi:hypothetical protein [Embleya sp. NBC_00896]|uniref:hypothetical protein n=1 Tax=Embleya sp. NBC_00896 TaxID=2975961 RepID=UPI00386AD43B|nr:hypothetical protein OG928_47340 [Embleya sp. NBC_00896]